MDKEDLYTLKINFKGKRAIGKANKGRNVENIIGLKILKVKIIEKRKGKKKEEKEKENSTELQKPT